jgi:hypothetical protein
MNEFLPLLSIPLACLANYIRGGNLDRVEDVETGEKSGFIPFRGLWLALPLFALAAWLSWSANLLAVGVWVVGYLLFSILPWGHLRGFTFYQPERREHPISTFLSGLFGRSVASLMLLYCLATVPLFLALGWLAGWKLAIGGPLLALALAAADRFSWGLSRDPLTAWPRAEAAHGAIWGIALCISRFV